MAGGYPFERNTVIKLNTYLKENGIAYRLKQNRFTSQIIDLLIDSKKFGFYAIECKSVKYTKGRPVYFSQYFTTNKKNQHQITLISEFVKKSGRKGFIFIEKRKGRGHKNITYAVPWQYLEKLFVQKKKGISWAQIRKKGTIFKPAKFFKNNR